MKLEGHRIRAAVGELQRVGLAGETDLVIFCRRDRRQRRSAKHDRQLPSPGMAHLHHSIQGERRHAVGQATLQVKLIEENAVGIRIRLGRGEAHLGRGVAELEAVRTRQLGWRMAKPLGHAGHPVGLGNGQVIAGRGGDRDEAGAEHRLALRCQADRAQRRLGLRVRVPKVRREFHLALGRVLGIEPQHKKSLAALVVAQPPLDRLLALGRDQRPFALHSEAQLGRLALHDFHRTADVLLRLATAMRDAVLGACGEDQLLLFLLRFSGLEIAGDDEAGLLAVDLAVDLEVVHLDGGRIRRLAKRRKVAQGKQTQRKHYAGYSDFSY